MLYICHCKKPIMKYILSLALAGLLLSCAGSDRQADAKKALTDSISDAVMKDQSSYTRMQWLDSTYQDLGNIPKGGVVEVSWRFRNTGDHPLVIASVQPGCGCTVAEKPEQPVAPGKEGVIRAKYDTKSQSTGINRKYISVRANTRDTQDYSLTFQLNLTDN